MWYPPLRQEIEMQFSEQTQCVIVSVVVVLVMVVSLIVAFA